MPFEKTHTGLDMLCDYLESKQAVHEAEVAYMNRHKNKVPWQQCYGCAEIAVQCNHQFMAQSKNECFFTQTEGNEYD